MDARIEQMRALFNDEAIVTKVLAAEQEAAQRNVPDFQVRSVDDIGRDRIRYDLEFFRVDGASVYTLDRYKAVLCPRLDIPDVTLGGVNAARLDQMMSSVPWQKMTKKGSSEGVDDAYVLKIYDELLQLARSEGGLHLARLLETKHYSHAPFAQASKLQKAYDDIEELYGVSHVFSVDNYQGTTLAQAFQMLKSGDVGLPAPYQSRLFEVFVERIPPEKIDHSKFDIGHYECRYFSSFQKAHEFASGIDDRLFFHSIITRQPSAQMVRHITICEEYEGIPLASKIIHSENKRGPDAVLGWRIYEDKLSLETFCQLTGSDQPSVMLYGNNRSRTVVARASDFKQGVTPDAGSVLRPKKGRDRPRFN